MSSPAEQDQPFIDAAYEEAFPSTQINAWQIHDGGKSKVSPDTLGIPRP